MPVCVNSPACHYTYNTTCHTLTAVLVTDKFLQSLCWTLPHVTGCTGGCKLMRCRDRRGDKLKTPHLCILRWRDGTESGPFIYLCNTLTARPLNDPEFHSNYRHHLTKNNVKSITFKKTIYLKTEANRIPETLSIGNKHICQR